MIVRSVKTAKILAGQKTIFQILDEFLPTLPENSVVVITSKIVSLCENRVVPVGGMEKEELIKQESSLYLPAAGSKYNVSYTLTKHSLIPSAGIDESNSNGNYVLWPANAQKTANAVRNHLKKQFGINKIGVVISDSTVRPLRFGTQGFAIAYSGFSAVNDYINTPDLFGRAFHMSRSGVAEGLAAAAVLVMGEGIEQTPLVTIEDIPFVEFQNHDPSREELENFYVTDYRDDLFGPFFEAVRWEKGGQDQPA